ncbi:putative autoinducer synthase protein [Oceanicola granulosus HTCC2516]|uniref:Acyl-homoserine-lactone synthase n=1 Tax=Oceanicola granulosus (strain ATCC BAA-861 / DSM 15982 / KCTC 12143 / HTCC2516) TaxID=314256 RepID=Q2CHR5_OCEGH|nr:acyl-homoserine-lactone synthase [Oceanicola granulosus]EAR52229.1 putative autoinducer synthase protein [Oceanicola granulosus HTCC2516]
MRTITFNLKSLHQHGDAFCDYLALRKRFFVDALGWDIPHDATVEMDQYDNPTARYSLVVGDDGRVLAGARALPTTASWGLTTYMLRDAQSGKVAGIPADLLDGQIVTAGMWECTRLVIAPSVQGATARRACLGLICEGLVEMALEEGARELMSLSNLWLLRALRQLGYPADLISRPYVNSDDGHRYAVMKMPAIRLHRPAAPARAVETRVPEPA